MTTRSADPALDRWGFSAWVDATRRGGDFVMPPELDDVNDAVISVDGRKMINFAGIGILGWQHDSEVRRVFAETATTYGLVVGGSRLVQGVSRPHLELERLVAEISGKEKALTFATGLLANVGFVNAMSAAFSFDDRIGVDNTDAVLVLDRRSHWSVWKGTEGFERGRNLFAFRHNDTAHLRELLEQLRGRRVIVGFETVYSADGSIAPIGAILDLCDEFGAVSFADDANGFMVYGNGGHRFAAEYEALRRVTFLMVSFGKGVGLSGGALAGPADAIDAFHYLSGTSMFTTNIQPPTAGAIVHVLRRMRADPSVMERYLDRVDGLRARLLEIGCAINPTPTYVTSIAIGSRDVGLRVRQEFLDRGYLVPMFGYPAVKKDAAVIRLLMNDRIADKDLNGFVDTLAELRRRYVF
ncbi:pyridoxal phosphate-dependent aminotransferase family protein [Frankia sp. AgB1.9]|uniref:aminotransferase class I/II-fold pyridoxal phosphate-dependent enzyme n=1 Tax=unclassified Frankia TaxID=2632575 RepID=UPI0019318454|nr:MULTISPECIES: pyridoxal phosphate-dependent aminotransferase family protein [unclassified Frankia]MBL7493799.1 pyridoxal phosphate-dependent aminotransferase family protein [Frankia sp. AgW1.1]MBL7553061.1 pyridoxal phosphate-dependent aminotransferase family protein [Frankia sp. AgB1.9]MBL7618934.1 pyridoxal phosphate-dependent aminotransferase family protein [Frankia sp. AgB1.8]